MVLKKRIRNLIIGKDRYIESWGNYKQVMLSGHFALIGIGCLSFYFLFDLLGGSFITLPVYIAGIFFLMVSIYKHRQGDHFLANFFLLPTINIVVYILASSESSNTGTFVFFIVNAVAAFAVFNYNQRLLSILFVSFTYVLFALAYFVDFSILPKRHYTDDLLLFNVVANFTFALPAASMSIYLLISLNHYNAKQLVQSNEMLMKTNAELDRFVYSTSHDLRAPLTSILGLLNIASGTQDVSEVKQYMGMMKDRVHSLDKFIMDITDYSRNNRLEIIREKTDLSELAREIWDSLRHSPDALNINFHIDIPEGEFIETDKNRLRIVMSNLISNAMRYHDARKDDRFIRLKLQASGRAAYLKVEDNGQGISPEHHHKIYDMFYRGNEKSKGSGLGLYIVKETLSKLAGSIHLESAPGVGSTFTVKLPR